MLHRRVLMVPMLAAVLSACGGGSDSTPKIAESKVRVTSPKRVAGAPAKMEAARTARVSMRLSPGDTTPPTMTSEGTVDLAAHTAQIVITAGGQSLNAVMADGWIYQSATGQAPWIKVRATQQDSGGALAADGLDTLRYLVGAGDVRTVGNDTIREVKTISYGGTISVAQLAGYARPEDLAEMQQKGVDKIEFLVWLDDEGRVRRLRFDYGQTTNGDQPSMDVEYFDFGVPAPVQVPPPDQVVGP